MPCFPEVLNRSLKADCTDFIRKCVAHRQGHSQMKDFKAEERKHLCNKTMPGFAVSVSFKIDLALF